MKLIKAWEENKNLYRAYSIDVVVWNICYHFIDLEKHDWFTVELGVTSRVGCIPRVKVKIGLFLG